MTHPTSYILQVLSRACHEEPAARFQSASAFEAALREVYQQGHGVSLQVACKDIYGTFLAN